jgi:hypothetical protein
MIGKKKGDGAARNIAIQAEEGLTRIQYQTSSVGEKEQMQRQIEAAGFHTFDDNGNHYKEGMLLQQGNLTIQGSTEIKDTLPLYTFVIERRDLPKAKDIAYAEDLLSLTSHEYLCYVFGEGAVKKDVFYYSETETNKCSVLFPNTNKEVIFIWNDEKNYRKTAFLMLGGQLQANGNGKNYNAVEHNLWRSNQGIYSGMTLRELQTLNGGVINFYGWQGEQAGMLAPRNSGKIDFSKIGLVLNCLNCNGDNYQQTSIVSSESQLAADKKVYVATIIIIPEKEKRATASR